MQIQKHRDVPHVNQVLGNVGTSHRFTRFWSAGQLVSEPDHDHTTEVYTSSAATVAASTAMPIAVMAPMVTVVVIIMVSVLTAPIVGVVVAASLVASIIPCSTSIGRPIRRVTVMVAFRILSTPSSIRVLGRDKTGNKQGNSQDGNELVNLHNSPLSLG